MKKFFHFVSIILMLTAVPATAQQENRPYFWTMTMSEFRVVLEDGGTFVAPLEQESVVFGRTTAKITSISPSEVEVRYAGFSGVFPSDNPNIGVSGGFSVAEYPVTGDVYLSASATTRKNVYYTVYGRLYELVEGSDGELIGSGVVVLTASPLTISPSGQVGNQLATVMTAKVVLRGDP